MADLQDEPLRILLVGRTGSGKSATGNTILGKPVFESGMYFGSGTKDCQKAWGACGGRELLVVDTPGLFDTKETKSTTYMKMRQCLRHTSPGPHAIILVVPLACFPAEEQNTFELVKTIFGERVVKHMIVLFTCKDLWEGHALSTFIAKADKRLKAIVAECDLRCCAFNNRSADEAEKEAQVQELVELIKIMVQENGGNPIYTENLPEKEDCVIL